MAASHYARNTLAYVGCRTTRERNARGDGIGVFRVGAPGAPWERMQLLQIQPNPSFLAFDRTGHFLLAVHGDSNEVSSFRINDQTGEIEHLGTWDTQGRNPVHLSMDITNRFLVVANHVTSSLAVLPFDAGSGRLGEVVQLLPVTGAIGPHRVEQPFPKPHQVEFDLTGRFVLVPDKGVDQIFSFAFDQSTGQLSPVGNPATSREGAGPRHIAFHPSARFAFVLNELDSTLLACRYDGATGVLTPQQVISSLPDTFVANSRAAEIAASPDGRFIYASNRGGDSIGTFAVDEISGRLTPVSWAPSGGRTPRFFGLDPAGEVLYAANEDTDTIVALAIDQRIGVLSSLGEVARTGSPTCILFRQYGSKKA